MLTISTASATGKAMILDTSIGKGLTYLLKSTPKCLSQLRTGQQEVSGTSRNPRNKTALKPGRSLMDWVRLTQSGVDLTGLKGRKIEVTIEELQKHSQIDDIWMAIKGVVYNVTSYVEYHPGGADELLRGAGKDATDLFNEVHRWVNIESMLSKCVVGKLLPSFIKPVLPSVINLKNGVMEQISKPGNRVQVPRPAAKPLPTFDWFQTPDIVSLCVYTKTSNLQPYDVAFDLTPLTFTGYINTSAGVFKINLSFFNKVVPECTPKILVRTGKVEFVVPKCTKQLWPSYGKAEIHHCQILNTQVWIKSKLIHREKLNHNTWSLSLQLDDSFKCNVPVGGHVSLRIDEKISAKYTPLISSIFGSESVPDMSNKLHFIIKVYPKGNFTSRLKDIQLDQVVMVSLPESPFGIQKIEGRQKLLCLAAGTGITPMVRLVREALNRDSFKEVKIIFWNRTEADMLLNEEFNLLATQDPRFHVTHVLTSPSEKWRGSAGRVNKKQIEEFLGTTDQSFTCICGPTDFTTSCIKYLSELHYPESSIYAFLG